MLSTTPTTAFVKQKLPTEIIGIICRFSDFKPHTAIRSTCSSVRLYVPLRKVVCFEEYKNLIEIHNFKQWSREDDIEKRMVFQKRIHLDLHHEELTLDQVKYLSTYALDYESCRIARNLLRLPEAHKGIENCNFVAAAASVGDLEFLIRLLQVPIMNPAASRNRAIRDAAYYGRLEIVQILLQDPRVDPSDEDNGPVRRASEDGHLDVVQELLQDPRVDPSDRDNESIRLATRNGHAAVVQALLQDPRVRLN